MGQNSNPPNARMFGWDKTPIPPMQKCLGGTKTFQSPRRKNVWVGQKLKQISKIKID